MGQGAGVLVTGIAYGWIAPTSAVLPRPTGRHEYQWETGGTYAPECSWGRKYHRPIRIRGRRL